MTVVDIQLSSAHLSWSHLRDAARWAESEGFGAIWVFDHLAGVALGGTGMIECFTLLGALGDATTTIELGTLVTNVWNRQPGALVTGAASVVEISGRPFHFGIGAGTSPTSPWAVEQAAVGAYVAPTLAERHARVEEVLDLTDALWRPDREARFATFPLPSPVPTRIIGVSSVRLSQLAGRRADGINVAWHHPRRDEFLAAADAEAGDRPFVRTVYAPHSPALLDPASDDRSLMRRRGIDRLVILGLDRYRLGI